MLLSAGARPGLLMRLWPRLAAALIAHRTAATAPGKSARGVDSLSESRLRDLGHERDQIDGNITFAKGDHQRLF